MRILLIDDEGWRVNNLAEEYRVNDSVKRIDVARRYSEAIDLIMYQAGEGREYDLISFDHDLCDFDPNGKERTGASIARWMAENGFTCKSVRVHSANPSGAQNIISIIKSGNVSPEVVYQPA